ncbi:hypothetical protein ACGFNP_47830 [Nonomuraea sp. NPDC049269]|uniref:hypothetical protein n=1 Tax=Nonomuraea sp. NPDC049269 TaxID=3364349 RepID=UPI003710536B
MNSCDTGENPQASPRGARQTNNGLTLEQRAAAITMIAEQAALGRLAVAHEVVPLESAGEAWQRQAAGTAGGRIVLSIA